MRSTSRVLLLLIVFVVPFLSPLAAEAAQFVVKSTRQDAATGHLVIAGSGFRQGTSVVLNGRVLRVVSVQSGEIRAELPSMLPGTYRLVLSRYGDNAEFIVTVGVGGDGSGSGPAGPAGPQGPVGPQGPAGLQGAPGPQGPAGAQGPAGPAGPAGATGAAGAAGATGAAGPTGATGAAGATGATGAAGAAGAAGATGAQGPQGAQGPAGPAGAAGGFNVVAANDATLGTLLSFGQPSLVSVLSNGVWLQASINPDGIVPASFPALYASADCTGAAFVPLETSPAPFFRLLQTVNAGDTTAYYAANPTQSLAAQSLSDLGGGNCTLAAGTGWDQSMLVGPLQSFDLTGFPAPFSVRAVGQQ